MNKNSTSAGLCLLMFFTSFPINSLKAQDSIPKSRFYAPQLFSATVSFRAVLTDNTVNLYWATDAEANTKYFEIERSFNQASFSTVGLVMDPQLVSNGKNQYGFKDDDNEILKHNIIYYRLKQVDVNGNYTHSAMQMVRINNQNKTNPVIQVMPNPYMDKLNVDFGSKDDGNAEITMTSVSGTIVKKIETTINKGVNNVQLQDLSSQPRGMYVINIIVNGVSIGSQKILKN
jgi:hypothetical protein